MESPESLEAVESWSPKPGIDGSDLEPGTARVIWWNCAQGLGAIAAPEGAARVHWTELPIGDELAYLSKGQLVSYSCFKPPESTCGRSTSFQREAVAVTPLGV
ncbi:MAG: hypothetical protein Q8P54_02135 [bacterium]|nr:hypothetical protein [bacterium]